VTKLSKRYTQNWQTEENRSIHKRGIKVVSLVHISRSTNH